MSHNIQQKNFEGKQLRNQVYKLIPLPLDQRPKCLSVLGNTQNFQTRNDKAVVDRIRHVSQVGQPVPGPEAKIGAGNVGEVHIQSWQGEKRSDEHQKESTSNVAQGQGDGRVGKASGCLLSF